VKKAAAKDCGHWEEKLHEQWTWQLAPKEKNETFAPMNYRMSRPCTNFHIYLHA